MITNIYHKQSAFFFSHQIHFCTVSYLKRVFVHMHVFVFLSFFFFSLSFDNDYVGNTITDIKTERAKKKVFCTNDKLRKKQNYNFLATIKSRCVLFRSQ